MSSYLTFAIVHAMHDAESMTSPDVGEARSSFVSIVFSLANIISNSRDAAEALAARTQGSS